MTNCCNCKKEKTQPEADELQLHIVKNKLQCVVLGLKILLGTIILSTLMTHSPEVALIISNL